jgi:hypothetical protein
MVVQHFTPSSSTSLCKAPTTQFERSTIGSLHCTSALAGVSGGGRLCRPLATSRPAEATGRHAERHLSTSYVGGRREKALWLLSGRRRRPGFDFVPWRQPSFQSLPGWKPLMFQQVTYRASSAVSRWPLSLKIFSLEFAQVAT